MEKANNATYLAPLGQKKKLFASLLTKRLFADVSIADYWKKTIVRAKTQITGLMQLSVS
jgi:hypothetical protein